MFRRRILTISSIASFASASIMLQTTKPVQAECSSSSYFSKSFVADAVEIASPSVTNIVVQSRRHRGLGVGSGFVISKDGLVVTNAHVIMQTNDVKCQVTLWDGRILPASVHSFDSKSDIALLQIDLRNETNTLPVAKIGTSSKLRAGDFVLALGAPLKLSNSVSFGIVSQVARYGMDLVASMSMGRGMPGEVAKTAFIQTDAAITQGNSGGPLVNVDGEVIGINTLSAQGVQGLSFAIPIDAAMAVINQLRDTGRVERPYIGIQMQDYFDGKTMHVMVRNVESDCPAATAGLRSRDVITNIDGRDIRSVRDVYKAKLTIGKHHLITVRRTNGSIEKLQIVPEPEREMEEMTRSRFFK
jgi:HtrA serine peptidase 2